MANYKDEEHGETRGYLRLATFLLQGSARDIINHYYESRNLYNKTVSYPVKIYMYPVSILPRVEEDCETYTFVHQAM
jgi:hypothetical protein